MKKKTFVLLLSLVLIVGCVIGGTLAWLTAKTDPVKNTFTVGDINIELDETGMDKTSRENSYKMVPGLTITKDPKVTVTAGSEKCYLFVKLDESANFDYFMEYKMADDWKVLKDEDGNDVTGVYYQVIDNEKQGKELSVLKDDQVTVKNNVTKTDMGNLKVENYPTLTVTAYACQYMQNDDNEFTPKQAWDEVYP